MKKIVLSLLVLGTPAVAQSINSGIVGPIESQLPRSIPLVFINAAKHIDQAQVVAKQDVADCSVLAMIPADLAKIGVGMVGDESDRKMANFAVLSAVTVQALGGCLESRLLANPEAYIKSKLDNAGKRLLEMGKDY